MPIPILFLREEQDLFRNSSTNSIRCSELMLLGKLSKCYVPVMMHTLLMLLLIKQCGSGTTDVLMSNRLSFNDSTYNPSTTCYSTSSVRCIQMARVNIAPRRKQESRRGHFHREKRHISDPSDVYLTVNSTWGKLDVILYQQKTVITPETYVEIIDGTGFQHDPHIMGLRDELYISEGVDLNVNGDTESDSDVIFAHGRVDTQRGEFDGVIHTKAETYYIEPASRYFNDKENFSMVFRASDIKTDTRHKKFKCMTVSPDTKNYKDFPYDDSELDRNCSFDKSGPLRRKARATSSRWNLLHSPNVTKTCSVHAVVDHVFFQNVGSSNVASTLTEVVYHLTESDAIFRSTDFDGDGKGDNIGFSLVNVTIYPLRESAGYRMAGDENGDVYKYLDNFSLYDFSHVCLAMAFTYRDFAGGVVGLAWIAKSSLYGTPGGLCQQPVRLTSNMKLYSFNTALITFTNFGKRIPRKVSSLTMTHEFGHNYGSPHDPTNGSNCSPGGKYGNYIMFPQASDGDKPYNNKFSQCSKDEIAPVIVNKGTCLKVYTGPVCGNGVVEGDEECDCGSPDQCALTNNCCTPPGGHSTDPGCTFQRSRGKQCDPRVSPCCHENCTIIKRPMVCHEASECMLEAVCDQMNPTCPAVRTKSDGSACMSGTRTCKGGYCIGSVCTKYALQECQCTNSPAHMCHVCCREVNSTCQPAHVYGIRRPDGSLLMKLPSQSCNNYNGFCNEKLKCVMVTSDSTMDRLNELFTMDTIQQVQKWFQNYWYLLFIGILSLGFLAAVFWASKEKKLPHHTMAYKCAKIVRAWSYACAVERSIHSRIARLQADYRKRKAIFDEVKPMDLVVAMGRMCSFFPTAKPAVVLSVLQSSGTEEFAVKQMLIKGYRMRRICKVQPSSQT